MKGLEIRLDRLRAGKHRGLILLPIDHGLTYGPISGLLNPQRLIENVHDLIDGVILHRGLVVKTLPAQTLSKVHFFVHLSASTSMGQEKDNKVIVTSISESLTLGATAVSIHIVLGDVNESRMLTDLGRACASAHAANLPILAMMYPKQISDDNIIHCARIAVEFGCDLIKIPSLTNWKRLRLIGKTSHTPILIAGGDATPSFYTFILKCLCAMEHGAAGVVPGRNIFQRRVPRKALELLRGVLDDNIKPDRKWDTDKNLILSK